MARRGLDLGNAHPITFVQIEKVNEAGLVSCNLAQCGQPGACLCTMQEVTQAFFKQGRTPIPVYGASVGEKGFEHVGVSLWSDTRTWQKDCESENYVADKTRIFMSSAAMPALRNIIRAATYDQMN